MVLRDLVLFAWVCGVSLLCHFPAFTAKEIHCRRSGQTESDLVSFECFVDFKKDRRAEISSCVNVGGLGCNLRSAWSFCEEQFSQASGTHEMLECKIHLSTGIHEILPGIFGALNWDSVHVPHRNGSIQILGDTHGSKIEIDESTPGSLLTIQSSMTTNFDFLIENVDMEVVSCESNISNNNTVVHPMMYFSEVSKLQFSNVKFRGCQRNTNHTTSRIVITNSSNIMFDGCTLDRVAHGFYSINFVENNSGITFVNSNFLSNVGGSLAFGRGNRAITIENSHFVANRSPCLRDLHIPHIWNDTIEKNGPNTGPFANAPQSLIDTNHVWTTPQDMHVDVKSYLETKLNANTNFSASFGGVVYFGSGHDDIVLKNSHFDGNFAAQGGQGGAIHFDPNAVGILHNFVMGNVTVDSRDDVRYMPPQGADAGPPTQAPTMFGTNTYDNIDGSFHKSYGNESVVVTVIDCVFTHSSGTNGGVFYTSGNILLNVINSQFLFNTASSDGGVIFGNVVTVIAGNNSVFSQNSAGSNGGVAFGAWSVSLQIGDDAIFESNFASAGYGGVVGSGIGDVSMSVGKNSIFLSNYAFADGGVLHSANNTHLIVDTNATFMNNYASTGSGGVVAAKGDNAIMNIADASICYNNYAFVNGGLIFGSNDASLTAGNNVTFTENYANVNGGVLAANGNNAYMAIGNDSTFFLNVALSYGGVVYCANNVEISIGDNAWCAENYVLSEGGFVYGSDFVVMTAGSGSTFIYHFAYNGAIAFASQSDYYQAVLILNFGSNCDFPNNYAYTDGSVAYGDDVYLNFGSSSTLTNNVANSEGGIVYSNGDVFMDLGSDSTISSNIAYNNGGIIYALGTVVMNIGNGCTFDNNFVDNVGGILYGDWIVNVTIGSDCRFLSNHAVNTGGIIFSSSEATINIGNGCTFSDNYAENSGGVMFAQSLIILNVGDGANFVSNYATNGGGVVYAQQGIIMNVGRNGVFSSNRATNGGVLYASNTLVLNASQSSFLGNSAGTNGGVVCFVSGELSMTISESQFSSNSAVAGGVFYIVANNALVTFKSSNFSLNEATTFYGVGGVCYATNLQLSSISSKFQSNVAGFAGGVFAVLDNAVFGFESGSQFMSNSAQSGGVVYSGDSLLITSTSSIFAYNTAGFSGGVFFVINSGSFNLRNGSHFAFNTAQTGGDSHLITL